MGLEIAGTTFHSRLILGTGGFRSLDAMAEALRESGAELATLALRRVDPDARGGATQFSFTSTAGNATLIANAGSPGRFIPPGIFIPGGLGGTIQFNAASTGGTSRVEVFGNGSVDISNHASPGVTIGSLVGNGSVLLGANNLTGNTPNTQTQPTMLINAASYTYGAGSEGLVIITDKSAPALAIGSS